MLTSCLGNRKRYRFDVPKRELHYLAATQVTDLCGRVGHSNLKLTMDVYGKLTGKMALGEEQAAWLDSMATATAETLVSTWWAGHSKRAQNTQDQPEGRKAISD